MLRWNSSVFSAFISLVLLLWPLLSDAVIVPGHSRPDLPGHSDQYQVTGSSGYGCQARDAEVILYRNPKRSGEDDGTLWTGETVVNLQRYHLNGDKRDTSLLCSKTYALPTLFWIGPYTQGSNGTNGKFALGMIGWETNSTDKSDTWHAYRPCGKDVTFDGPSDIAFELKGGVRYHNETAAPLLNDTTFELQLMPPPASGKQASPSKLFFNGTYNGVKETEEYLGRSRLSNWRFTHDLDCVRSDHDAENYFEILSGSFSEVTPGTTVNGSLTNSTITLRLAGSEDGRVVSGVESPTPSVTSVTHIRTEFEITFNGRYDTRNSSQDLVIGAPNELMIAFTDAATQWLPSSLLLYGVLVLLSFCWIL